MSFADIKKQSKENFKNIVKNKIQIAAFEYLRNIQATHSKSKQIQYKSLELQSYLKSGNDMTIQEKCFVFQARSHCVQVKCNFKVGLSDLRCRQCGTEDEIQEHIMTCKALVDNSISNQNIPEYCEIFGDDPMKITIIGRILQTKFKNLTNNLPNPRAHSSSAALDNIITVLSDDLD